jgi:hypothetical protein
MTLPIDACEGNPLLSAVYAPALQRAIRNVEILRPDSLGMLPGRLGTRMLHNPAVAVADFPAAVPSGNAWTAPQLRAALTLRTA